MKLSRREQEIMDIVYQLESAAASDVQRRMSGNPSNSAVRTFLTKLVEKGALRQERDGLRYLYSPTEPRSKAARREARRLMRTFFDGDPLKAATAMLGLDRRISAEQARELHQKIDSMIRREEAGDE